LADQDNEAPITPIAPQQTGKNTEKQSQSVKTVTETSSAPQIPPPSTNQIRSENQTVASLGPAPKNEIYNLEFKMEGDVSRIFVTSRFKLRYREQRNSALKQYVYFFENATVPERIERAYDTSEFVSPVALFTLLQVNQKKSLLAKLIIQLREDKTPTITNTEKGIFIDFPAPEDTQEARIAIREDDKRGLSDNSLLSSNPNFTGKPIERLEIKQTDIQDVIRLIGRTSGYNIVIGEDVTGKIGSLSLENIPWDQAFALVLQSKKLGYVKSGNVIRVATLASLKTEKEETAAVEQSKLKAEPLRTVLIPVSYAKAEELAPKGKSLMTERGTLEVDQRSNSVIVRDVDAVIGKLQKLYAMLDTQPPIVSVSAKIVEMKSDFSRQFGMNLLKFGSSTSGLNLDANFDKFPIGGNTVNIKAPDFAKLEAQIGLSEVDGETKILANPTVSVNQNQKATMSQTLVTFFPIQSVTGGVVTTTLTPVDAILSLEVTPIVAGDGSISMTVNIKNEVPQKAPANAAASVDKRNVQTQVLLENGDTAVIGGAFSSSARNTFSGVPGLMRLPLVGALFSSNAREELKNEILIFLTAKILNVEESFKRTF
jgi:type IV pilus assembly protein PilQ